MPFHYSSHKKKPKSDFGKHLSMTLRVLRNKLLNDVMTTTENKPTI